MVDTQSTRLIPVAIALLVHSARNALRVIMMVGATVAYSSTTIINDAAREKNGGCGID